jgi:hypothetical protein
MEKEVSMPAGSEHKPTVLSGNGPQLSVISNVRTPEEKNDKINTKIVSSVATVLMCKTGYGTVLKSHVWF